MNQQDIVWVRLPFSNVSDSKVRPGVVLSNDAYNHAHPDVLLCALTSNLEPAPYKVPIATRDVDSGELGLESMARVDKILQVEKELIDRRLARLGDDPYDQIIAAIDAFIARPAR